MFKNTRRLTTTLIGALLVLVAGWSLQNIRPAWAQANQPLAQLTASTAGDTCSNFSYGTIFVTSDPYIVYWNCSTWIKAFPTTAIVTASVPASLLALGSCSPLQTFSVTGITSTSTVLVSSPVAQPYGVNPVTAIPSAGSLTFQICGGLSVTPAPTAWNLRVFP